MTATTIQAATIAAVVDRLELVDCLEAVAGVIKPRSPKPALQCVKVDASERGIEFTGTNAEVWVRATAIMVDVRSPGVFLVDCALLLEAARRADGKQVSLDIKGDRLTFSGDSSNWKFGTQSATDFPSLTDSLPQPSGKATASGLKLKTAITFASHACPAAEVKHGAKGILFEANGDTLSLAATDDKRLAVEDVKLETKADGKVYGVVPTESAKLVARCIPDDATVEIAVRGGMIEFDTGHMFVRSALVEKNFPPYRSFVPKSMAGELAVPASQFSDAVRRTLLTVDEERLRVILDIGADGTRLSTVGTKGETLASVPGTVTGKPIRMGINSRNLAAAIDAMGVDDVQFSWNEFNMPAKITAPNCDRFVMVMPVDIN